MLLHLFEWHGRIFGNPLSHGLILDATTPRLALPHSSQRTLRQNQEPKGECSAPESLKVRGEVTDYGGAAIHTGVLPTPLGELLPEWFA